MKAKMAREIVVKVRNEIGVLDQMCRLMADQGVNNLGVSGISDTQDAVLRFVTTDNLRACDLLRERHFSPHESDCILFERPNKPGILRSITADLAAEGINIDHLYATAGENHPSSLVVFATSNNERALIVLNR